jgi:hypothetical protein
MKFVNAASEKLRKNYRNWAALWVTFPQCWPILQGASSQSSISTCRYSVESTFLGSLCRSVSSFSAKYLIISATSEEMWYIIGWHMVGWVTYIWPCRRIGSRLRCMKDSGRTTICRCQPINLMDKRTCRLMDMLIALSNTQCFTHQSLKHIVGWNTQYTVFFCKWADVCSLRITRWVCLHLRMFDNNQSICFIEPLIFWLCYLSVTGTQIYRFILWSQNACLHIIRLKSRWLTAEHYAKVL